MKQEQLTDTQKLLADRMSEISEKCFCAGWMSGLEYVLWESTISTRRPFYYGMGEVPEQDIRILKTLSNQIDGWIYWRDDTTDSALPVEEWGETFVPLDIWQRMYTANQRS